MSSSDAGLVAGLVACEPAALRTVYDRYADRLYSFAVRLSGRPDVADELFQHAWLTLAERAPRLSPDTNLLAWLITVTRNHFRSQHRKALTHRRNEESLAVQHHAPARPDETVAAQHRVARLELALSGLAEHHREVLLLMVEASELPQAELAAVLGLSPAAFRKRLSRARAALQAQLGES